MKSFFSKNLEFQKAEQICQKLWEHGCEAYLVGGCVRDFLLKKVPKDFDVATNAKPDQVKKLFTKTIDVGLDFGVVVVIIDSINVDVVSFRKDQSYKDGRHPEGVELSDIKEDAQRRDFSINALFYDLQNEKVIDFYQGQKDLEQGAINTIGLPKNRFSEDHLRLLRAARLSSELNFFLNPDTEQAMNCLSKKISKISKERIHKEFNLLLEGRGCLQAIDILYRTGLLREILPTLSLELERGLISSLLWLQLRYFLFCSEEESYFIKLSWIIRSVFLWSPQSVGSLFSELKNLKYSKKDMKNFYYLYKFFNLKVGLASLEEHFSKENGCWFLEENNLKGQFLDIFFKTDFQNIFDQKVFKKDHGSTDGALLKLYWVLSHIFKLLEQPLIRKLVQQGVTIGEKSVQSQKPQSVKSYNKQSHESNFHDIKLDKILLEIAGPKQIVRGDELPGDIPVSKRQIVLDILYGMQVCNYKLNKDDLLKKIGSCTVSLY